MITDSQTLKIDKIAIGGITIAALLAVMLLATGGAAAADPSNVTVFSENGTESPSDIPNLPNADDPPKITIMTNDGSSISKNNVTISGPGNVTWFEFPEQLDADVDQPGTYDVSFKGVNVGTVTVGSDTLRAAKTSVNKSALYQADTFTFTVNNTDQDYVNLYRQNPDQLYFQNNDTSVNSLYTEYDNSVTPTFTLDVTDATTSYGNDWSFFHDELKNADRSGNMTLYFSDSIETITLDGSEIYNKSNTINDGSNQTEDDPLGGGSGGMDSQSLLLLGAVGAAILLSQQQ